MKSKNIPEELKSIIKEIEESAQAKSEIKKIYLLGSQAYYYRRDSDIDILVVLYDEINDVDIISMIYNISKNNKMLIHPIIINESQFKIRNNITIYKNNLFKGMTCIFERGNRNQI